MVFESQKLRLESISTVMSNEINDCLICRDLNDAGENRYTALLVHDHQTVGKLLKLLSVKKREQNTEEAFVDSMSCGNEHLFVYPWKSERPLDVFYMGDSYTLQKCEEICKNAIICCINAGVSYPMLYLMLTQGKLNLSKDSKVYLTYTLDLTDLDITKKETDCVVECAQILLDLLEPKARLKAVSYELLKKRIANRSYSHFTDLYRDICIAAAPAKQPGIITRFKRMLQRNKDRIFGVLFWVSLALAIIALILFFTSVVLGDIPFLRLFFNNFKQIGTESLKQ